MFGRGARRQAQMPAAASRIPQRLLTEDKIPTGAEVLPALCSAPAEQQAHERGGMLRCAARCAPSLMPPPPPPHAQTGLLAGLASAAFVLFVLMLRRHRSTSVHQWSEDMVDKAARAAAITAASPCMAHTCEVCTRIAHPGRCSR